METISISRLKAHLNEELRKVEKGMSITILSGSFCGSLVYPAKAIVRSAPPLFFN
jgi:hypothetical protein